MSERPEVGWTARAALTHPAWWAALTLLLANDHYLKGGSLVTPLLTGKLSDFAGLLMAPALAAAALAPSSKRAFALAHLAVAAVFTALKLSRSCADAWCSAGAAFGLTWRVVSDPSDLLALPMLGYSHWLFGARLLRARVLNAWRRLATAAAGSIGFVASVATSRAPPPRVLTTSNVYVGLSDGLAELDRATGRVQRVLPCQLGWSEQHQIVDSVLYSTPRGSVEACDLRSGRRLWTRQLGFAEIVTADDTRVVVRTDDRMWALDRDSGRTLWEIAEPSRAAISLSDRLALRTPDHHLELFRISDGAKLEHGEVVASDPIALGDTIYVFQDNQVVSLDASARIQVRSEHRLDRPAWSASRALGRVLFAASPGVYSTDRKTLLALDTNSLRERWRLPSTVLAAQSTQLVFTHHELGCSENSLEARETTTGRWLWRIPWCAAHDGAVADETLFVSSSHQGSGTLVVARTAGTGQTVWHTLLDDGRARLPLLP
jgi:outer membrane protein assembly factor BamB